MSQFTDELRAEAASIWLAPSLLISIFPNGITTVEAPGKILNSMSILCRRQARGSRRSFSVSMPRQASNPKEETSDEARSLLTLDIPVPVDARVILGKTKL